MPALLNLGLNSKLRACELVALKVREISYGAHVASRASGAFPPREVMGTSNE